MNTQLKHIPYIPKRPPKGLSFVERQLWAREEAMKALVDTKNYDVKFYHRLVRARTQFGLKTE
jgi:hypothetical protein